MLRKLVFTALALLVVAAAAALAIDLRVLRIGRALIVPAGQARPAQAALVLGALVFPDGGVSDMVADRLITAYDLYQRGLVSKILVSGDHGHTDYDEVNTMRRWLEARGVPTADIFMDHAGFNTYNSMVRARAVFQVQSAIVITQRFHLPRALYLARAEGLQVQGVVADRQVYRGAAYYEWRETVARIKAFTDVLLHSPPVFLGPIIPITGDGRATHDQP